VNNFLRRNLSRLGLPSREDAVEDRDRRPQALRSEMAVPHGDRPTLLVAGDRSGGLNLNSVCAAQSVLDDGPPALQWFAFAEKTPVLAGEGTPARALELLRSALALHGYLLVARPEGMWIVPAQEAAGAGSSCGWFGSPMWTRRTSP
jgi:hypothetical protein